LREPDDVEAEDLLVLEEEVTMSLRRPVSPSSAARFSRANALLSLVKKGS
jgi:hypothetical protein